jgi:acetyl esterase/lipase
VKMRDGYEVILHIYEPNPPTRQRALGSTQTPSSSSELRPCVINFHGGGFTIGSGTDDSRWAHWCTRTSGAKTTKESGASSTSTPINTSNEAESTTGGEKGLGAIFISIEYRLAPEYPHPTPVNDCIDSTLYIINNAKEFGIDKDKVFLSGFSAGGSLAVTTALALSSSLPPLTATPSSKTTTTTTTAYATKITSDYKNPIAGVIAFYPVLDFNTPRSIKRSNALAYANSNSGGKVTPLPGWMTRMFDTSYLPPHLSLDRMDPMISPGLAPDLGGFPNIHLILCGADVLAHEGRVFGERLQRDGGGRKVVVRTVPGARHGWDKPPLPLQGSVSEEYDAAIESMMRWCQ